MADIDFIMAMSCVPPALLGLYRYKRVDPVFHPFIFTLVLSVFTEVGIKFMKYFANFTLYYPLANFYLIINVLLFYLFFRAINPTGQLPKKIIILGFIVYWLISCFINNPFKSFPYTAAVASSVYILATSVKLLSMQVFETRVSIFRNPCFYIATGAILFYAMSLFTTVLGFFSTSFDWYIYEAEKIVNVFHYFLFLSAILWMHKKHLQSA